MSSDKFTNTHIHVFNAACVPNNFLRVVPKKFLRRIAPQLFNLLSTSFGRLVIKSLAKMGAKKDATQRTMKDKYIAFLNVGLQNSQLDVYEMERKTTTMVDPEARMVVLTINMDYMDDVAPPMRYNTQIEDIKNIRRYHPSSFFPFYGVDPRHLAGDRGLQILRNQMESGFVQKGKSYPYFFGLKLYPALGYFPFDKRLTEIYQYAEKNLLPIMTHCTRVGSQYIGSNIINLIPNDISLLYPPNKGLNQQSTEIDNKTKESIQNRITKYYEKGWIANNKIGDNDYACDLFGHPENYIPLMLRFPKLKICLAHMGGSYEIDTSHDDDSMKKIRSIDPTSWFEHIGALMCEYENMYTDISYTLSSFAEAGDVVLKKTIELMKRKDKNGNELAYRILFGTDFFMTEQEMREEDLINITRSKLGHLSSSTGDNYWELMTKINPTKYLNV